MKLTDEDLQTLEKLILEDPRIGVTMEGTGGVRKVRFAPPSWHTGKSGATRVCYALIANIEAAYLLTIFQKNEKPNLSAEDKATLRKWMEMMKSQ